MKKILKTVVITASLAYYAILPFMIVQAYASPIIDSPTGSATSTVLYMRVTAYASVPDETDSTPFITANGTHVHDGIAASNILPFGTKIEIPELFGDKVFTIEDRTSPRFSHTVDIWMPTTRQALIFGVSHVNIVVLGNISSTVAVAEK